jgi:hypothetical protein
MLPPASRVELGDVKEILSEFCSKYLQLARSCLPCLSAVVHACGLFAFVKKESLKLKTRVEEI